MTELILLAVVTTALSVYLIHRLQMPAERFGLMDMPGGRKDHEHETPLVGGIAIFVAFSFGALLLSSALDEYRPLFAGMGLLLIVGFLDDLHDLGAREKFAFHLAAACVLIFWGDLVVTDLGHLPLVGEIRLGPFAIPFTAVCVVGLINAVNMLDGLDGLAGTTVLGMLFWLAVVGLEAKHVTALALPILLGAAVLGFLAFNFPWPRRPRARVFMGDSGSTILGFALAWFAVDLVVRQETGIPPVSIAWVMALPIVDAVCLMLRRVIKGRNPMDADREHLHHIFLRAGVPPARVVYIASLASFVFGAAGVLAWKARVPDWMMWAFLLVLFVAHWLLVRHAWRAMRYLRTALSRTD